MEQRADNYDCCPICMSETRIWTKKNTLQGLFRIDRCCSCGYAFVNPRPEIEFLKTYYVDSRFARKNHGLDFTMDSLIERERQYPNSTIDARRILKEISGLSATFRNRRFLDIGCGYGFFTKEALACGFEVVALELASYKCDIVEQMTSIRRQLCSFENYESVLNSFSVILMSQSLEHALDVNIWLDKASNLLMRKGILAIALPNYNSVFRLIMQRNDPYICPPEHLNFFSPSSLQCALKKHGFTIERLQHISRIPKSTYAKYLPYFVAPITPMIAIMFSVVLRAIDLLHAGIMINAYARKL